MKNKITFDNNTVIKQFHSHIACSKEKHLLEILNGSGLCPQLLAHSESCLETEYISGITLAQAISEQYDVKHIFQLLLEWVIKFNTIAGDIVLDDINLKNFIYNPVQDKVYGMDFECWHNGDSRMNIASVCGLISESRFTDTDLQAELYKFIREKAVCPGVCSGKQLDNYIDAYRGKVQLRRKAMPLIRQSDCVIIAGGKSSRMGQPKGLLEYNGFSFVQHIIYNTSVFDRQYISANSDIYNHLGCEIIADNHKDIGPLGALEACIRKSNSEYVFFIPCDMPFINEENIFHLYSQLTYDADAVVMTAEGRVFPTVAVYRKNVLPLIEEQIETENYRLMELLDRINTVYVQREHPQQFGNINTPQDYKKIIK